MADAATVASTAMTRGTIGKIETYRYIPKM